MDVESPSWGRITIRPVIEDRLPGVDLLEQRFDLAETRNTVDLLPHWQTLHARWSGKTRAQVFAEPHVAAQVAFVRQLGLDPKRHPPAAANLIIRFLLAPTLSRVPQLSPLVDAVNLAAAASCIPLALLDAATIAPPLVLDVSQPGEILLPIGGDHPLILLEGTVVLRDTTKVVSWFLHRDGDAHRILPETRSVWLLGCVVPGITETDVLVALENALHNLRCVTGEVLSLGRRTPSAF